MSRIAIVTASTNLARALPCLKSWGVVKDGPVELIIVANGMTAGAWESVAGLQGVVDASVIHSADYLGTVPAFRVGVDFALRETEAEIICCLHDDLELLQADWAERTIRLFETHPACGLAGFGGAIGLGSDRIYKAPYDPMQLARIGFRSNMIDAEVHGIRSLLSERVACLDGFSQVGRREFWNGEYLGTDHRAYEPYDLVRPLEYFEDHGIVHHCYDSLLGCWAARANWETWYLPIRCRHLGGQTAVGDQGYQDWAKAQIPGGDMGYWQQSHQRGYELFKDVLPLRV